MWVKSLIGLDFLFCFILFYCLFIYFFNWTGFKRLNGNGEREALHRELLQELWGFAFVVIYKNFCKVKQRNGVIGRVEWEWGQVESTLL